MTLIDLITIISLVYALFAVSLGLILAWRSPSKPKALPRFLALGGGISMFVSMMTASTLLKSTSAFASYTLNNLLISVVFAIVVYYSGSKLAQRIWNRKQ